MNQNDRHMLQTYLTPYRAWVLPLFGFLFVSVLVDGFSIALIVPLLNSLQRAQDFAGLPALLQPLAEFFAPFAFEQRLLLLIGAILLAVLVKNIFYGLSVMLGYWLTGRVVADIRLAAVRLLLSVDVSFFHRSSGAIHLDNIMSNTLHVEMFVRAAIEFLVHAAMLLGLLALMTILSWQFTLVTVTTLIVIALLLTFYIRGLADCGRADARARGRLAAALSETLGGIYVIRYLAKESAQLARLNGAIERFRRTHQQLRTRTYLTGSVTESLGIMVVAALFLFALLGGRLSTPADVTRLLTFLVILVRILPALKELYRARAVMAAHYPYLERVAALLSRDDKPFLTDGTREFRQLRDAIELRSVSFRYPAADRPALRELSLVIPRGQTVAVVGASGSGKTTLIRLLMRLYDPQTGHILLNGKPLPSYRMASLRNAIGIVSQDTFLFNDTAFNNIAFGTSEPVTKEAVVAAARQAEAHAFLSALPEGYETKLGERGVLLSGGQRQRIAIARAILKNPEILILDEATSALDNRTERDVRRTIRRLSRDRTVIVIAHRLSTVHDADQIIVLNEGRVVERGDRHSLLAIPGGEYADLSSIADRTPGAS